MAEAKADYTPNEPELLTVEDLSYLVYMEMENVLDTLEHRWKVMKPKQMYTSISTILIAINPYERIHSVYTEDVIQDFFKQAERGAVTFRPPHPYGVGARSYTRMIAANAPQSVIICGESGAGKTETAKLVIRYLAQTTPGKGESSGTIEMQIMNASPILEAFGNAKTVLNNNSSRFGKFTKVLYTMDGNGDVPAGSIVGATLETYLLEKSRVIFQANKERNYHSFYFTVAGLSDEQKAEYGVQDLMKFYYTNQGGAVEVPGISDIARYDELKSSLSLYRMGESNQQDLWQSVLAVLHLGNVNFIKDDQDFAVVDPKCKSHLEMSARLFGVETKDLQKRLETASLKVGKKTITKKIQFSQGANNRDAITKGFYEKIFLYLAKRINDDLSQVDDSAGTEFQFIGILDVFGFENFKVNSLEQFCINFTNEKLQNYFNKNIIESEQEEYLRESVVWTEIDVPNSQPMIDLVEDSKKGMFNILDSACQAPKPDVEAFHQELFKNHPKAVKADGSPLMQRGKPKKRGKKAKKGKYFGGTFYHYADKVTYDFEHFISKNNEKVSADTAKVLGKSTNELVKGVMAGGKKKKKKKKFTSVTGIFSKALKKLMTNLDKTKPYFIRCVNPNKEKSAKVFVRQVLEDQLRCGGILEALRVLKLGYPTRVQYQLLYQRYQGKIDNPLVQALPPQKFAAAVLIAFGVNQGDYELGLTKIFFKPAKAAILEEIMNQTDPLTEEQNQRVLDWLAQARIKQLVGSLKVFAFYSAQIRDCRALDRWSKVGSTMGAASLSLVRFMKAAKMQLVARKNKEAATAIQAYYRAHVDRAAINKKLKKRKTACKKIFKAYHSYQVREKFMVWLTDAVEKTRIEEERKRKEEEARRKAEAERIRKEEEERKKAEEAMKAAQAEEDRAKLAAEEAERKRKADEEALKQKQAHAREDLEAHVKRQIQDTINTMVSSAESEEAAQANMKNSVTDLGNKEVAKVDCLSEADDVIDKLIKEFMPIVSDAYAKHQAELKRKEEEKLEAARLKKEEAEKNRLKLEKVAEKQRERTKLITKERATQLAIAKKQQKKAQREMAEDNVDDRMEEEYERDEQKGQSAINEFLDTGDDDEEDSEPAPEEHKEPLKWNMKSFLRTAGNGTLFRKHKYRRRWDDASRYQPKEVFIKVNFDHQTHEPLRITWGTGNRHVEWESVKLIAWGLHTPTYTAMAKNMQMKEKCCFSVVSTHTILDVQNDDPRVVEMWVKGLRHLLGQTDEEANKLSDELRKHPPTTKKSKKRRGRKEKAEPKQENEQVEAVRQDRTESLILLQKDLFILTTTTVFRNLEEQYLDVPADIKAEFNPNDMYEIALKEDVSWRAWQHWLTDKILARMREKGYLGKGNASTGAAAAQPGEVAAGAEGEAGGKKEDCIIS